jgi:hypothetical protein
MPNTAVPEPPREPAVQPQPPLTEAVPVVVVAPVAVLGVPELETPALTLAAEVAPLVPEPVPEPAAEPIDELAVETVPVELMPAPVELEAAVLVDVEVVVAAVAVVEAPVVPLPNPASGGSSQTPVVGLQVLPGAKKLSQSDCC